MAHRPGKAVRAKLAALKDGNRYPNKEKSQPGGEKLEKNGGGGKKRGQQPL